MARKLTTDEYRKILHSIILEGDREEWTASQLSGLLLLEANKENRSIDRNRYGYYHNWDDCIDWTQRVAQVLRDDPAIFRVKKKVETNSRYYTGKKHVYVYSIDRNNIEWWIKKGLGKELVYYCGCRFVFTTKNPDRLKLINYDLCPTHSR